jgi:6-phosphogluconolactonase (cycloisomerase 2 family)
MKSKLRKHLWYSRMVFALSLGLLFLAGCGGHSASTGGGANSTSSGANPVPTIAAISPTSALAGSATGFALTINGTNFVAGATISFGGTTPTPTFVSSTQLTAAIPAAAIMSAGTTAVTVTNPAPGGGTSNMVSFAINSGTNPIPTISLLDPGCAPAGAQTFTLAVIGTNFAPSSVIRWNGTNLPTTLNTYLLANIPASDIATAGTATVTVFNPAPGGGVSSPASFNIVAGGVGPTSLAVDPTGKFAYVANEGCPDAFYGSVSMYTINPTDGTLTSAGPPLTSGDFGADSVAVDPSGRFVYVANWGEGNTAGSVSSYAINGTTGILTPTGTMVAPCASLSLGSCAPWSLAVHPSGKFVYVANDGGFTPTSVSMYAIDTTPRVDAIAGVLDLKGIVAVDGRATSVTVDPSGKFAYVTDGGQNSDGSKGTNVSMYSIDATTGVLTSIGTIAAGPSPSSITIHPGGKFVYVGNSNSNDLSIYTIDATTGKLTLTGTVTGISGIVIHPSGKFGYSGASIYAIDTTTGALTFAGTTGTASGPSTIHPSGKFAYGLNSNLNTVSMYSIDPATGALKLIGTI